MTQTSNASNHTPYSSSSGAAKTGGHPSGGQPSTGPKKYSSASRRSNSQTNTQMNPPMGTLHQPPPAIQQNGSNNYEQLPPMPGCLYVKQFGCFSVAGNVGRTGTSKVNQDSVFVSKLSLDGKAMTTKEQLKQGPAKADWFCAVADGHGANGHFVSQFIQQHMPKQYEQEKRRLDRQKQAKELVNNFKGSGK